jgi:plasmid maintenance system antidote protein VapI
MTLGEFIAKMTFWSGLSQKRLADGIGIPAPSMNDIIRGKRDVNVKVAKGLEKVFGIPAAVWMVYQSMEDIKDLEEEDVADKGFHQEIPNTNAKPV